VQTGRRRATEFELELGGAPSSCLHPSAKRSALTQLSTAKAAKQVLFIVSTQ